MTSRDNDLSLLSHLSSPNKLLNYTRFLLSLKPLIPIRSPSFSNETDTLGIISPLEGEVKNLKEERRPSTLIDRTNPLAVLLFLLEGLIFLRSTTITTTDTTTTTTLDSTRFNQDDGKENFEQLEVGGKRIRTDRLKEGDQIEIDWESWKSYIQEVVSLIS